MSNESSKLRERISRGEPVSFGEAIQAIGADAQREPELSNAEIAEKVVRKWNATITDGFMRPPGRLTELINNVKDALDAKDTRSRPTVAENFSEEFWGIVNEAIGDWGGSDKITTTRRAMYREAYDRISTVFTESRSSASAPSVEAAETCVNHCIHSSDYVENGTCRHNGRHGLCGHVCKFKTEERRQAFDDAIQIAKKLKSGWDVDCREHYWISAAEQIADALTAARDAAPTPPEKD